MIDDEGVGDCRQALALLSRHGLVPGQDELDALVASYPVYRMLAESSYALPGVRTAEPATTFSPSAPISAAATSAAPEARGSGGH